MFKKHSSAASQGKGVPREHACRGWLAAGAPQCCTSTRIRQLCNMQELTCNSDGAADCVSSMQAITKLGVRVHSFDEFLALGQQHPAAPVPPSAEDYCTIMYTSGTTGDPKVKLNSHHE